MLKKGRHAVSRRVSRGWAIPLSMMLVIGLMSTALAVVDFDQTCSRTPSNSQGACGFVGKGDVQNAFTPTWNDAQLQSRAPAVSFSLDSHDEYEVTIQFSTGNPAQPQSIEIHTVGQDKSTEVFATVAYDSRRNSQGKVTGFLLTGLGNTTITGDLIPEVGDSCPNGNIGDCEVIGVDLLSSTGGLFVHWNGSTGGPLS